MHGYKWPINCTRTRRWTLTNSGAGGRGGSSRLPWPREHGSSRRKGSCGSPRPNRWIWLRVPTRRHCATAYGLCSKRTTVMAQERYVAVTLCSQPLLLCCAAPLSCYTQLLYCCCCRSTQMSCVGLWAPWATLYQKLKRLQWSRKLIQTARIQVGALLSSGALLTAESVLYYSHVWN